MTTLREIPRWYVRAFFQSPFGDMSVHNALHALARPSEPKHDAGGGWPMAPEPNYFHEIVWEFPTRAEALKLRDRLVVDGRATIVADRIYRVLKDIEFTMSAADLMAGKAICVD